MADPTGDIAEGQALLGQESLDRGAEAVAHQIRDVAREKHAEAVVLDAPTHHVEGLGPRVLAPPGHRRAVAIGGNQRRGGAVTEQRRGDDVALVHVLGAKRQAAQLGHQQERPRARARPAQSRRPGQSEDAAGAAEPEDRQSLHIGAQAQALHEMGVEAGRGKPPVDDTLITVSISSAMIAPRARHVPGGLFQKLEGMVQVEAGALRPPMPMQVPFKGHAGVAGLDAGVAENGGEALDSSWKALEDLGRPNPSLRLGAGHEAARRWRAKSGVVRRRFAWATKPRIFRNHVAHRT